MKKFYTLILGTAVAFSMSAGIASKYGTLELNRATVRANLAEMQLNSATKNVSTPSFTTTVSNDLVKELAKKSKAQTSSRITVNESWSDAGTVKFVDAWLLPVLFKPNAGYTIQEVCEELAWEVPVQVSSRDENRYKLIDPYHQSGLIDDILDGDTSLLGTEANDIIIDASNPDAVSTDLQLFYTILGDPTDPEDEDMTIYGWTAYDYFKAMGATDAQIQAQGFKLNTFANGVINLYQGIFGMTNTPSEASYNWNAGIVDASVSFEGALDYKLNAAVAATCINDGTLTFAVQSGADVASAKCLIFPGMYFTASNQILDLIEQQLPQYIETLPATTGQWGLDISDEEDGPATFFILAYDADGKRVNGTALHIMIAHEDKDNWTTIGTAKFTDDLMASVWVDANKNPWNNETYDVEIQESRTNAGLYRLVNPFSVESWSYVQANGHDHSTDCKHFLYIDATNPDAVEIPLSYPGFESSYGHEIIVSQNTMMKEPDASLSGKLADKVITFPAKAILESTVGDFDAEGYQNWYTVNNSGKLKIELPAEYNGINSAVVDTDSNAPVEYFNLQGVRVANPAAGELVIKRQGATVTKTIIR